MEPNIWAIYFLFLIGIVVPVFAIRSNQKLKAGKFPARRAYFRQVIFGQAMLLIVSLLVVLTNHIALFPPLTIRLKDVTAGAAFLTVGLGTIVPRWRLASETRKKRLEHLVPQSFKEKWLWLAVCLAAAVAEEIGYRGVMFTLFMWLAHSWWIAAIISSTLFAVAHMVQGWKSAVTIFFFALGFHLLVLITGALYIAIAVHFLYDIMAGLILGWLGKSMSGAPAMD